MTVYSGLNTTTSYSRTFLVFCLLSFSIVLLRFIHVAYVSSLFLLIAVIPLYGKVFHNLCIHSPNNGQLSCFQFGAVLNKAAMNIHLYVDMYFISIGQIPKSGLAGPYDRCVFSF